MRSDSLAYEAYVLETKQLLAKQYPWYGLTPTIHKLLDHSIVRHFKRAIGIFTEEPQEARHKDCRFYRLHNSRKTSREHNIFDLLGMLLASSDPAVNTMRGSELRKVAKPLDEDLAPLMRDNAQPDLLVDTSTSEDDYSTSSSDDE